MGNRWPGLFVTQKSPCEIWKASRRVPVMRNERAGLNLTTASYFILVSFIAAAGMAVYLGYQLFFMGVSGRMSQSIESKAP
jgi:hypothetical protein